MWFTLPAHTPLYRVTRAEDTWDDALAGIGAFFGDGGRYSTSGQPTVYTSEDPLAALTEFAWHLGLSYCAALGDHRSPVNYPLSETAKLWRFELNTPITLADLTHPSAAHHLGFPAHLPYNPHPDQYHASQAVATRLRAHRHPRPEGLLAPSVRTPGIGTYTPKQVVLFVLPAPAVVPQPLAGRTTPLDQWDIELEFGTAGTHQSVAATDPHVAWASPWVRFSGTNRIPRLRPRSIASLPLGVWLTLDVRYTQH